MTSTEPIPSPHAFARKVILITGASSGIGEAAALRLSDDGHHVVVGARRTDRLDALVARIRERGGSADAHFLDVTDLGSVVSVADRVVEEHGVLDAMINNAGVMPLSRLDALLVDEWRRTLDVNVNGLLHGIAATLPHFQRQGQGHFVTIASVGAHSVSPTAAVYCGSKYAAWAITEGLRLEVDPSIRVTTISPGVVDTELADHITDPAAREGMNDYRKFSIPAASVADAISFALRQPVDVDISEVVIRPAAQR
jgi:NADP-dependent 3-hydroxy acid dehydrogenase YdfG